MMINKRLIGAVPESKKYIAGNVALQWCSLFAGEVTQSKIVTTAVIALAAVAVRYGCTVGASRMGYLSSKAVKKTLRGAIYDKLLCLGASYSEQIKTSEVVQVAVEGVDQLETYFGAYLPQFFYAMLAPLTLFVVLCFVSVPLIPVAIAAVQTWAKKLLSKYWGQYTALGDTFLENLQGLTTLKIYQADAFKNDEMNVEAEKFRKITMKVLTMQLNSITIMDLIAYGGAALGVIMAATQLRAGKIDLAGALLIILLAADFFIPMRQLGSFFHKVKWGVSPIWRFERVNIPACREMRRSIFRRGRCMDTAGNIFDRNPKLRFLKRFVEINNILMAIMGFILFAVMCTIVVIRFFFHKELSSALEYLYFALVWLFFLGACNASYEKSHLRADTLEVLVKDEKVLHIVEWVKQVLQIILHVVFLVFSVRFIMRAIATPAYTSTLRLPYMIGYLAVLYGAITMLVYTGIHFYDFLWQNAHRGKKEEN